MMSEDPIVRFYRIEYGDQIDAEMEKDLTPEMVRHRLGLPPPVGFTTRLTKMFTNILDKYRNAAI